MATLMTASNQWASRPDDERFTSLDDLLAHVRDQRRISDARIVGNKTFRATPGDDPRALLFEDRDGRRMAPTHWAFGQACSNVGAPAKYLRTLPSDIAADAFNASLAQRKVEQQGMLSRHTDEFDQLAAVTGPTYGRIWNDDVVQALVDRFGNGRDGAFTVPGEFGRQVPITKDNTTIYGSDRDVFVFLADERNRIEMPGRRNGQTGQMARGFFMWNSEVGKSTFGVATFLFDYVCSNRIVWGAEDYKEIKIRHTSGAPDRWMYEVAPAIEAYAQKSTLTIEHALAAARAARIGSEEDVDDFLTKRFTKPQAHAIKLAHLADEDRPIETLWDATVAATAYARGIKHQDDRVAIERTAGKILTLAR